MFAFASAPGFHFFEMIERRTRGFDLFRRCNGLWLVHRRSFMSRGIRVWRSVRRLRCRRIRLLRRYIRLWRVLATLRLCIRIMRWLLICLRRRGLRLIRLRLMRLLRRLISRRYRRAVLRGLPVLFFLYWWLCDRWL